MSKFKIQKRRRAATWGLLAFFISVFCILNCPAAVTPTTGLSIRANGSIFSPSNVLSGVALSVKQWPFNATGDGTTIDYAAFTNAIARATNGTVFVPRGVYNLGTTGIVLNGAVSLVGEGSGNDGGTNVSTLLYTGVGAAIIVNDGTGPTTHNMTIRNLKLDGGGTGARGLELGNSGGSPKAAAGHFENLYLTGFTNAGIHAIAMQICTFIHVHASYNHGDGMLLADDGSNTATQFLGCRFNSNRGYGVQMRNGWGLAFYGCTAELNNLSGFFLEPQDAGSLYNSPAALLLDACWFEKNSQTNTWPAGAGIGSNFHASRKAAATALIDNVTLRNCIFGEPNPKGDATRAYYSVFLEGGRYELDYYKIAHDVSATNFCFIDATNHVTTVQAVNWGPPHVGGETGYNPLAGAQAHFSFGNPSNAGFLYTRQNAGNEVWIADVTGALHRSTIQKQTDYKLSTTAGVNLNLDSTGSFRFNTNQLFLDVLNNRVGFWTLVPSNHVDIVGGAVRAGADTPTAHTRSDLDDKTFTWLLPNFTNAATPIALWAGYSDATASVFYVGGSSLGYAPTAFEVWTAANNYTLTGSKRFFVTSTGQVVVGATGSSESDDFALTRSGAANAAVESLTSGQGTYKGYGFSTSTSRNAMSGGGRVVLWNKDTTAGNYTSIHSQDSAGLAVAGLSFNAEDHVNHVGSLSLHTRPSGGSLTERIVISSGGNLGIGDLTPVAQLTVGNGDLFQVSSLGALSWNTTTGWGLRLNNLTTAQRDALVGVVAGASIWNTTATQAQVYDGAAWSALGAGTYTAGAGIDITGTVIALNLPNLVANQTIWNSANASRTLTIGLSGATDPTFTFADNSVSLNVPLTLAGPGDGGVAIHDADSGFKSTQTAPTLTANRAVTWPDRAGTVSLSGDTLTGDVMATLETDGTTATTIAANAVALTTDTTGNYVESVATSAPLSGGAAGSEGAVLTLGVTADGIGPTQIDETASYDWSGIHTFDSDAVQIDDTDGSHQLIITPGSNLTLDRVLTITTGDAARTVTINGDTTLIGSNTGDQTITLTGDVTGSGTGSFAATIAADSIALATDTTGNYVASTATSAPLTGGAGGSEGAALTLGVDALVNKQTGTTYTILTGDKGKLVTHTNAAAIAVTLPQAGGSFPAGWWYWTENHGPGTVTITPTTSKVDGAATLALTTGQGAGIFSDGTDYWTMRGVGGAGGSNALLDGSAHTDTLAGTVVRGDLIVGNATPKWARLAAGPVAGRLMFDGADPYWATPYNTHHFFDDLDWQGVATVSAGLGWSVATGGTGSGLSNTEGEVGEPGIVTCATGTDTTGYAGFSRGAAVSHLFSGGRFVWRGRVKLPTLSDDTDDYVVRIGLGDSANGDFTDGAYFQYNDNLNTGNWVGKTANNGVRTSVNGAVAVGTAWTTLLIDVNAAGTSVEFFAGADGANLTSLGTSATNIPITTGRGTAPRLHIVKTAGTTSRTLVVGYVEYWQKLTTTR